MNINTSNFPLYNILIDKINKDSKNEEKISITDRIKFINFVKTCDDSQSEIIYTIIRIYELKNVKKSSSQIYNIPYKGIISIKNTKNTENTENKKNEEKDITFDFNLFPLQLQKMLIHFININ